MPISNCDDMTVSAFLRAITTIDLEPVKVIFANPSTIVYWNDGTKTVVTCQSNIGQRVDTRKHGNKRFYRSERALPCEDFDKTTGLALCHMKKMYGNTGHYCEIFKEFGAWE